MDFTLQPPPHSARLFLVNLDDIILLHLQSLRSLVIIDPPSIEQEPETGLWDSHPLAVRLLQFPHLSGLLHTEVDLVRVLAHNLQLDVFSLVSHLICYVFSCRSESSNKSL